MSASAYDHPLLQQITIWSGPFSLSISQILCFTVLPFVLFPVCRLVHRDYSEFMALGPGGTPKTIAGYLRISYLRLFTLKDPFSPPPPTAAHRPANGFLLRLPKRPQPRPTVAGIAPHRQTNQKAAADIYHLLRISLYALVRVNSRLLRTGNSCFEKHGLALFLCLCPQCPDAECHAELLHSGPTHLNATCQDTGEICHLHPSVSPASLLSDSPSSGQ